jgi:16S rRNA (cytidine1402-2'-O)-methyltransferase
MTFYNNYSFTKTFGLNAYKQTIVSTIITIFSLLSFVLLLLKTKSVAGKLYLIPTPLGTGKAQNYLNAESLEIISLIRHFVVEEERTARRFLSSLKLSIPIPELTLYVMNEHTKPQDMVHYLDAIDTGNIGLMSEAGVPCVADPGNLVVRMAHQKGIRVVPLVGPSSIIMALMASGLIGQNFTFNGYLPINSKERMQKVRQLEKRSQTEQQTQIFIEAPYRNMQLLKDVTEACNPATQLCIAADITLETEYIKTLSIKEWKTQSPELHKRPAIFLIQG